MGSASASASASAGASLAGRRVLVTAGPTREPIDPVRYLGNRSSGKMGFAIAARAAELGAETELVAGPVSLPTPPGVERIDVETALEMCEAVYARAPRADLVVMTAAVADFRPRDPSPRKLKKEVGPPAIELVQNPDILTGLAERAPRALRVGFAAETDGGDAEAMAKLERKRAHVLVWNDVSRSDVGFGAEANEVRVYRPGAPPWFLSRRPKSEVAAALVELLAGLLHERERSSASGAS